MTEIKKCKPSILVVDDEIEVGSFFRRLLQKKGYVVAAASCGSDVQRALESDSFSVALVDLKLPDTDGLTLLQEIKSRQPGCEVIIMTGYSTTRTAVKAIQLGAFDYIDKPFEDIGEVEKLIEKALDSCVLSGENGPAAPEWAEAAHLSGFLVGSTAQMHRLASTAYKIARKDINVLIYGETGTGKEVLARFIHAAGSRAQKMFIPVNCGALSENLLESELFGHEKGAFTGAAGQRKGIFELANHGTLFLDEIGEASQSIQVKLLRVLETGEFLRVGGEKPIKTDVRIIAATNVDLDQAVKNRAFREDLFYRLDVVRFTVPPLRSRREDIPLLTGHFIRKYTRKSGRDILEISPEAHDLLAGYLWPGNVRELANSIEKAVALCDGPVVLPGHLPEKITVCALDKVRAPAGGGIRGNSPPPDSFPKQLEWLLKDEGALGSMDPASLQQSYRLAGDLERKLGEAMAARGFEKPLPPTLEELEARAVAGALEYCGGNVAMAARFLGIGRNTLYRKIKDYKIAVR